MSTPSIGPLQGVRVLELGSFIAGPFAGQLLGDYGADVIKVEPPGAGDPMRRWGVTSDGKSLWWPTIARNKRSVAVDLRSEAGQAVVRRIAVNCDIVLENFRPGRIDEWGLDYASLSAVNPKLVMVHVSGFGQTGPFAHRTGFGSVGEAMGGIRFTTGSPDRPPSRSGISLGDALAALFAVNGAVTAYAHAITSGRGQEVDVAIYEAVAALMESTMADYELAGVVRERTGSVLAGVAPSNVYPTADGAEVIVAANADTVFRRLCEAMSMPELADDPRFAGHADRGANMDALDAIISQWTATFTTADLLADLEARGVPAGQIYTAREMVSDPQYLARDMVLRRTTEEGWNLPMTGVVPRFERTPGAVRFTGPALGQHTSEVLGDVAGFADDEIADLVERHIVATS
jgi:formyl-CoA transferase